MSIKLPTLPELKKFAVTLVGAAATGINLGLIHGTEEKYVQIGIAVLTMLGVYVVPNTSAKALEPTTGAVNTLPPTV